MVFRVLASKGEGTRITPGNLSVYLRLVIIGETVETEQLMSKKKKRLLAW